MGVMESRSSACKFKMKSRPEMDDFSHSASGSTEVLTIDPGRLETTEAQWALTRAAEVLRNSGTVAFPTETVYGLGANALDRAAVAGIFTAKQRPVWDPLIVHISSLEMLRQVVAEISPPAQQLIETFWPGPLTLLLPRTGGISDAVTAGRELVGVRLPAHPVAQALIALAGVPIAAPSANRFGHTSPTTAQHVLDDLNGRIDLILNGGAAWCGVESTVIEVQQQEIILYRPGAISREQLEGVAGAVSPYQPSLHLAASPASLPSPGVGIRHYAPRATVVLVDLERFSLAQQREEWMRALATQSQEEVTYAGLLLPAGWPLPPNFAGQVFPWGKWEDHQELAQRLYAGLRTLDAQGVKQIICPLPASSGLGCAIRDRLLKAARTA